MRSHICSSSAPLHECRIRVAAKEIDVHAGRRDAAPAIEAGKHRVLGEIGRRTGEKSTEEFHEPSSARVKAGRSSAISRKSCETEMPLSAPERTWRFRYDAGTPCASNLLVSGLASMRGPYPAKRSSDDLKMKRGRSKPADNGEYVDGKQDSEQRDQCRYTLHVFAPVRWNREKILKLTASAGRSRCQRSK